MQRFLPALVGVAVALGTAGCGSGLLDPPAPTSNAAVGRQTGSYDPTTRAAVDIVGLCIDPTASTVKNFSAGALRLVSGVVRGWETPLPAKLDAGTQPQPGLDLELRQVGTDSYATTSPYTTVQIDALPALKARPDVTASDFTTLDPEWEAAASALRAEAAAAQRQAAAGAAKIAAVSLDDQPNNQSEILGCVTALGETLAPGADRRIVLYSDLEQDKPPQSAHALDGTRILIVQACDSGNATACGALSTRWRGWLRAEGASAITFIRPEQAAAEVPQFMEGNR